MKRSPLAPRATRSCLALRSLPLRPLTLGRLPHRRPRLAGDRLGAASVFNRYREVMQTELGLEPSPATVAAFEGAIAKTDAQRI
jgi:hypothetical protein